MTITLYHTNDVKKIEELLSSVEAPEKAHRGGMPRYFRRQKLASILGALMGCEESANLFELSRLPFRIMPHPKHEGVQVYEESRTFEAFAPAEGLDEMAFFSHHWMEGGRTLGTLATEIVAYVKGTCMPESFTSGLHESRWLGVSGVYAGSFDLMITGFQDDPELLEKLCDGYLSPALGLEPKKVERLDLSSFRPDPTFNDEPPKE